MAAITLESSPNPTTMAGAAYIIDLDINWL